MSTILITGVTRGLGRAMLAEFTRAGHQVLGCGRSISAVDELREFHPQSDLRVVDVARAAEVERWAEQVLQRHSAPDLLLNNAAVINRNAPLWNISEAEFGRVVDINIKGVVNVIRAFLPPMLARRTGVIVNFSSGWGRSTSPEVAPYCATKWAIEGLTRALADELPSGMAAVPLNPGIINTEMLQSCFGSSAADYPLADAWARTAVPFLLRLGPKDNGKPLTAPGG
jgi:NAD(P)-dependent dehydrogenase (short-subunit alcohol dehydrogenase family)